MSDSYEQMELDTRPKLQAAIEQLTTATVMEVERIFKEHHRQVAEETMTAPPYVRNRHEAYGIAAEHLAKVEMCEPATIKYTGGSSFTCSDRAAAQAAAKRTYEAAVELFAYLCQQYNLDPLKDGVIVSHREGHARGIASNHGDPEHLWKGLGMSYTMDTFRAAVKAKMSGTAQAPATPATSKPATSVPYLVRVKVSDLHIRSGPGTNYASKGFIAPGAYTIVEESTGQGAALWGKLKSGKGWIALGYTEKV